MNDIYIMLSNKTKQITTSIEKFEPSRLSIEEFKEPKFGKGQKTAWIRYNHPSFGENSTLMLQTPWITLTSGGIPRFNPDFHKNDRDRAFIRLPIEEGTELYNKLSQLDEQFTTEEFKKEKFGKSGNKYSMYPIVKIPEVDEDDDRPPLPPSMKIKFDLLWNEDDMDACDIKTQVYTSKLNDSGKRERKLTNYTKLSDMESIVRLGSKLRLIIRPMKAWMSAKKEYGIVWKIMKMEVEPSSSGNALMKAFMEEEGFLDSDSDEDEVAMPVKKATKEVKKVPVAQSAPDSDDSEEEDSDEDESDSDDDSPKIPVKKSRGKKL
jgi:hypothetical protein